MNAITPTIAFANNATSTLPGEILAGASTITIQTADAYLFPQIGANQYFMVTIEDPRTTPIQREICRCTSISGNTLYVVRGQEGTVAQAFQAGATVANRPTAGSLMYLQQPPTALAPLSLDGYAAAPVLNTNGSSLLAGQLYFNTIGNVVYQWSGTVWLAVPSGTNSAAAGLYIGYFASPPSTGTGGVPLLPGMLYYNTTSAAMQIYSGSVWLPAANVSLASAVVSASSVSKFGGVMSGPLDINVIAQGTTGTAAPYGAFGILNTNLTLNTSNDRLFNYQGSTATTKIQGAPNSVSGVYQANLLVYSLQGNGAFSPAFPISQYSGIASQVTKGPPGLDPNPPTTGLPVAYSVSALGPQVWAWYSYVAVQGNPINSHYENPSLTWEFDNSANGDDTGGGRFIGGQLNGHLTTALGSGGYPASWTYGIYFEFDAACINLCHIATNQYAVAGIEMRPSFVPTGTIVAAGTIGQTVFEVDYIQVYQHSNRFFADGINDFPPTSPTCPLDVSIISAGTTIATTIIGASVAGAGTNNGYVTLSAGAGFAFANGATFVPATAPIALRDDAYICWGFDLNVGLGVSSATQNLTVKGGDFQAPNMILGDYGRLSFNPAKTFQAFFNEGDNTLQFVMNSGTVATNVFTIENSVGAVFINGVNMWGQTPLYTSRPVLTGATTDPVVLNMASIGAAYGWWTNSTT